MTNESGWKYRAERAESLVERATLVHRELFQRACKAEAECASKDYALRYVLRWWDECGRDQGWHDSIGKHVINALSLDAGKGWLSPEKAKQKEQTILELSTALSKIITKRTLSGATADELRHIAQKAVDHLNKTNV